MNFCLCDRKSVYWCWREEEEKDDVCDHQKCR